MIVISRAIADLLLTIEISIAKLKKYNWRRTIWGKNGSTNNAFVHTNLVNNSKLEK